MAVLLQPFTANARTVWLSAIIDANVGVPVERPYPVVHGEQIHAPPGEQGGHIVIVRHDLAVSVEEKEIRPLFLARMKPASHNDIPVHGDENGLEGTPGGIAPLGARIEQDSQDFRTVQGLV